MSKEKTEGLAFDALLLALVKVVTLSSGIVCAMILSRSLGLDEYGTYSQGNTVATLAASITILGLGDAVNYFFNKDTSSTSKRYVNTVIAIQLVVGIATAIILCFGTGLISSYFDNPLLNGLMVYVVLRPLLTNMTVSLQVLLVSINKAKLLALRNLIMAIVKIVGVCVVSFLVHSLELLFGVLLAIDAITVVWFFFSLKNASCCINPFKCSVKLIRPILSFSVPMAVYVMCTNVSREVAKLVIGYFEPTSQYAIFANCSTVLPLDFISSTLLVVLIPVLTRMISTKDFLSCKNLVSKYLEIGYLTTITFASCLLVVSKYAVIFLYGEKYVSGVSVFSIYLFAYMMQFASMSLVLSASGNTKKLMAISLCVLGINSLLCVISYKTIGFEGPAYASVLSTLLLTSLLLHSSAKVIESKVSDLIDAKKILAFAVELIFTFILVSFVISVMEVHAVSPYLIFISGALLYALVVFGINGKRIVALYRSINSIKTT